MVVSRIPQVLSILRLYLRMELVPGHPVQGTRQISSAKVVWSIQGSYTVSAARSLQLYPVEETWVGSLVLSISRLCLRVGSALGHPLQAIQRSFTHKVVRWIQGSYIVSAGIMVVVSLAELGVMVYFLRPRLPIPPRPA